MKISSAFKSPILIRRILDENPRKGARPAVRSSLLPMPKSIAVPGLPVVFKAPGARRGFFGARMLLKAPLVPACAPGRGVTNITNNLRLVNRLLLHISLKHTAGALPLPKTPLNTGALAAMANTALDTALMREIDRELALMARGENVAHNQHRRGVMQRHLERQPYQVIRRFYGAQMRILAADAGNAAALSPQEEFHSDILHERSIETNRVFYEKHVTEASVRPAALETLSVRDASKIADRVMEQVEKRMRARRDRNGMW